MFDLDAPWGRATMRGCTRSAIGRVVDILHGVAITRGASAAQCGLCHWRTVCRGELERADDLTLVAELGRKVRRDVEAVAQNRTELAELDLVAGPGGRTSVPGLGAERLRRFRDRARLQLAPGAGAYAREPLGLSSARLEWHLDIEADPTRGGLVYLHGVWERRVEPDGSRSERFVHMFAEDGTEEGDAFGEAWRFLNSDQSAMVYYYSSYERTAYRALQRRHPLVCMAEEVEAYFASDRVVDLFTDVLRPRTEWPLSSYGIKPIARSLGFSWSAEDAGGASSIAWFDEYSRTRDPGLRAKIIEYNRQDCQASAVVLDALMALPVGPPPWPPIDLVRGAHAARTGATGQDGSPEAPVLLRPTLFDWQGHHDDGGERRTGEAQGLITAPSPPRDHRPAAPRRDATPIYALPTLKVCLDDPAGDPDGRLDRVGARLLEPLPLLGGGAMRPVAGGGLLLCDRLREALPWLEDAIGAIERQLRIALWAGRPWLAWRPLCLDGGPGVGKSFLAREVGRIAGVPGASLDLGGMHDADALALAPTSGGWSSAKPCWPAAMMAGTGCANPLLVLDELDKFGGSRRNGDPQEALLGMLEPSTASAFHDTCLAARLDLSAVCWIATVNHADRLPAPLRSRLEVVRVPRPDVEHMEAVVAGVMAGMARRWDVPLASLPEVPRPRRPARGVRAPSLSPSARRASRGRESGARRRPADVPELTIPDLPRPRRSGRW